MGQRRYSHFIALMCVVGLLLTGCGSTSLEIDGTFGLVDDFPLKTSGDSCSGSGGYGDINSLTPVTISHIDGTTLARTALGDGKIPSNGEIAAVISTEDSPVTEGEIDGIMEFTENRMCLFRFSLELEPGSDEGKGYVVAVGDRGEQFLNEEEIQEPGAISLSLGDWIDE